MIKLIVSLFNAAGHTKKDKMDVVKGKKYKAEIHWEWSE